MTAYNKRSQNAPSEQLKVTLLALLLSLFTISVSAQQKAYQGIVMDDLGPLPGVTVVVKGTTDGAYTDTNGQYNFTSEKDSATLVVSYLGYKKIEIASVPGAPLEITMEEDLMGLDEVIVVGYGQTQNKRTTTTAIATVGAEKFEKLPVCRPEQALQGNAPGAILVQESGSPGAPLTIRLRGVGTAGNSTPLILLDGVQVPDMSFVNANDIQDVTVLKDAASTAIYGSRGGNGVLLVTTKNNKKKDLDRARISFNTYAGLQQLPHSGDYLNTQQYAQYYNASVDWLEHYGMPINGRGRFTDAEIAALPNTNWVEEITEDAWMTNHHFSVQDGTGRTSYYVSGGLFAQDGIVGGDKTEYKRQSVNVGLNTDISDKLNVSGNIYYAHNDRQWIAENTENGGLMSSVISLPSLYPTHTADGIPFNNGLMGGVQYINAGDTVDLNTQPELGNPFLSLELTNNKMDMSNFMANGLVDYDISKALKFNASYAYLKRDVLLESFSPRFDYAEQGYTNAINTFGQQFITDEYAQSEQYLTFTPELGKQHKLDVIGGSTQLINNFMYASRNGSNFIANAIEEVNFANIIDDEDEVIGNDAAYKNTTLSFYTRANYTLNDKYMFSATFRADGSSKFGPANRWGYFPAASAGWIMSEESFMKDVNFISLLKLRASYGVNGNDQIAPYQYVSRYVRGPGSLALQDVNENIKWEEVAQINAGLDVNLIKDRIGITLDYYQKTTKDMLLNFPNPALLGSPTPVRNAATVTNNGVELMVAYKDDLTKDLSIDVGFNVAYNKNEISALGGGEPIEAASTRIFKDAPNLTRTDEGQAIASFYGYEFAGLDTAGNITYVDQNGDGEIDAANDRVYLGNPYPDLTYGFTLQMDYKNFDLSVFLQGVYGNEIVNASMQYGFQYTNRTTRVLDAWTPEDPTGDVARSSALEVTNHEFSDYYIEDGSYMRIKNVSLGYTFSDDFMDKIKSENLRVYASVQNLLTFTKYSGLDPEIGTNNGNPLDVGIDRGFYPSARTILAGLQYQF